MSKNCREKKLRKQESGDMPCRAEQNSHLSEDNHERVKAYGVSARVPLTAAVFC